jgi:hypothetical protein
MRLGTQSRSKPFDFALKYGKAACAVFVGCRHATKS